MNGGFRGTPFDLTGRVAVVTGGSTGLGYGMAEGLAEAGADIVLVDRQERTEARDALTSLGRNVESVTADLSENGAASRVVERALARFGRIDVLVNNAGIIRRSDALEFSERDWDDVMQVNAKSVFFLAQAAARGMKERRYGRIINVASLLAFQGGIRVPSYAASKGAVAQVTKALANEWAAYGITVNAVAPGYMATNNTRELRGDAERERSIADRIPAGRWGRPEDLKGAAVFLASDAAAYVNGHVLVVDGGWMAR